MHGVHTGNAEELSRRGPESFRSLWRKIGSAVLIPTAEAEKFCRTSRQCPAEALPRNKALRSAECSDHPAAVMTVQEKDRHAFGPPSMPEGGPRRTRRLRHGLSQNTERPCSNTCKGFRLHEILPPDVLRRGRSQAVVRRRRGEVNMLPCCLLRTLCDFQMSGLSASRLFRSR